MGVEQRRAGLKVEIPKDESPRLGRVGLIAAVGFAIGAVWPSIADFKLVPSAPAPATQPGLGGEPVAASAQAALPSAAPAPTAPAPATAAAPAVGELQVTSCRGQGGRKVETCDALDVDRVLRPRLLALGGCAGAAGPTGVLSIGFELDFEKNAVVRVANGKSTTLRDAEAEAMIDCARRELSAVKLDGVAHQHSLYTVFYRVEFTPPEAAVAAEPAAAEGDVAVTPATGRATVSWEVALVRSEASRDGKVVARILSGTRVVVTGRNGDWYQIKYDAKGSQGWVYRTAIGM